jgi:hypothetical protein
MHLAAEKFIVLGDLRIDGETVRISERLPNMSRFVVCHSRHTYSDTIERKSNHRKSMNRTISMFI